MPFVLPQKEWKHLTRYKSDWYKKIICNRKECSLISQDEYILSLGSLDTSFFDKTIGLIHGGIHSCDKATTNRVPQMLWRVLKNQPELGTYKDCYIVMAQCYESQAEFIKELINKGFKVIAFICDDIDYISPAVKAPLIIELVKTGRLSLVSWFYTITSEDRKNRLPTIRAHNTVEVNLFISDMCKVLAYPQYDYTSYIQTIAEYNYLKKKPMYTCHIPQVTGNQHLIDNKMAIDVFEYKRKK